MARSGNVDIASVFEEYLQKEQQFDQEIEERNRLRREIRDKNVSRSSARSTNPPINLEKSRIRNQILLKDLEMCRARLRTYASYTPTDEELQQISSAYRSYLYKKLQSTES
ncbi:hypothetical protein DMN91_009616 [Ooceraea biroi]|uniref:Uncharacterized protein n=1 Tax=Ooceraea biroi TaxID=2015173 RepID=A0A026WJY3_OOCBI|nr:uncharacterized protein LOC105278265 [Ooceraea biroi]EZA56320.1 hypothetical protein X777_02939 [Ooceraea biroi]RLU17381.1 hypothetical protein DMN91_009616 [Ooceraea biroi]